MYDNVPEFTDIMKTSNGTAKPVLMIISDGGPDENPRYKKVLNMAIHHFVQRDLDAIFISCNAPGRSAFNRVERRMAPLSKELAGLILPHDFFGSHLNSRNETVDEYLEQQNFQKAGETLASVWGSTVIDGFETVAAYIPPDHSHLNYPYQNDKSIKWISEHVHQSQYLLQIIKCGNRNCCSAYRCTALFDLLPNGILPPPIVFQNNTDNPAIVEQAIPNLKLNDFAPLFMAVQLNKNQQKIPYDRLCPSVQTQLPSRICPKCSKYFATKTTLNEHLKIHRILREPRRSRVLPNNVLSHRQQNNETECLVLVQNDEGATDAEWYDTNEIDIALSQLRPQTTTASETSTSRLPIITFDRFLSPLWEEDK